GYVMKHLTTGQYQAHRTASARRLLQAANHLAPRRSTLKSAALAVQQVRLFLGRRMLPKSLA
ncbi:MAG TPA: hypothetical protein VGN88_04730, partial [Phycisphaerae bacterium]